MAQGVTPLLHRYVFGYNVGVANNGVFIDNTTIGYAAGNVIVFNNLTNNKQRFINSFVDPSLEGCSCLSLDPSRKYLAVGLRAEKPEIHIFDTKTLRKKKSLVHAEATAKCSIVAMQFTHNGEKLVALSGQPDCTILVFQWLKGKKVFEVKLAGHLSEPPIEDLYRTLSLNPVDSETMVVTGPGALRFFRLTEERAQSIQAADEHLVAATPSQGRRPTITAMCWLKQPADFFVVGNDQGKLAVYGNGEFITFLNINLHQRFDLAEGDAPPRGGVGQARGPTGADVGRAALSHERNGAIGVSAVVCVTSGLIIGCSDGGFRFLARSMTVPDGKPGMYELAHQWFPPGTQNNVAVSRAMNGAPGRAVMYMKLSESEDDLVASFDDGTLLRVNVAAPGAVKGENMKPVSTLAHTPGIVTGLDVCVRKPLAVTCCLDRTIRLWNYAEQKLELTRSVSEEPWSVAFHPSGLHIVVGFSDKLRLMNLLMDDIRMYRELPVKLCREVQFSHGGQYFAAANQSNVVLVFNFYTCEKLADLRGHSGKVKSISWTRDDATLVTCGHDGALYMWDWEAGKRLGEFVQKGIQFNATLTTNDGIYAASSDLQLKEFDMPEMQVSKETGTQVPLSQIVLNGTESFLFAATGLGGLPGMVRAYDYPVSADYVEYACMSTPITRLRITPDDRTLIATDEAGCVVIFDVKDRGDNAVSGAGKEKSLAALQRSGEAAMPWSEEILITRSDLEEKNALMVENRAKVEELQLHNEYQLRLRDMSYSEKVKEIQEKFMQDVEQEKNKYELLREEKNDMQMEYEESLKQMEDKHQHELQDEENTYQEQIMAEVEDYQRVIGERNMQRERWEEQRNALVSTHERYVQELTDDFEQKLEEDRQLHQQLEEEKTMAQKEYTEMHSQLEDDIDTEIENLRDRYDTQLNHER
jgi:WD40 repeat protein